MKLSYTLALPAVCSLLIGCSDINVFQKLRTKHPAGSNPPVVEVFELSGSAKQCACSQARQFAIRNNGGPGVVDWIVHMRDPQDVSPRRKEESRKLESQEVLSLACTVEVTDVDQQCRRSTATEVEGKFYGGGVDTILGGIVISAAQSALQHMPVLPERAVDCAAQCADPSKCLVVEAHKSGDVAIARSIAIALKSPSEAIPNSFIVNLTKAKTNVCERSDIAFAAGRAYNVGLVEECQLSTVLPFPFRSAVTISIPKIFSFQHKPLAGENFDLSFDRRDATPNFIFADPALQAAYGGRLLGVTYTGGRFVMQTETQRCVAVRIF